MIETILRIWEAITPLIVGWLAYVYSQERKFNREQKIAQDEKDLAKKELDLCVARILLLENYERCMDKGFYTVNERNVYHQLFENYVALGGDGVIEDIMDKLIELPTELD